MTLEQQRIAIAEICGWKWFKWGDAPDESWRFLSNTLDGKGSMIPCDRPSHGTPENLHKVPNYPNDLNAMHEAEKVLTDGLAVKYNQHLWRLIDCEKQAIWQATAAQRAEAFLRTLDLWVDQQTIAQVNS